MLLSDSYLEATRSLYAMFTVHRRAGISEGKDKDRYGWGYRRIVGASPPQWASVAESVEILKSEITLQNKDRSPYEKLEAEQSEFFSLPPVEALETILLLVSARAVMEKQILLIVVISLR